MRKCLNSNSKVLVSCVISRIVFFREGVCKVGKFLDGSMVSSSLSKTVIEYLNVFRTVQYSKHFTTNMGKSKRTNCIGLHWSLTKTKSRLNRDQYLAHINVLSLNLFDTERNTMLFKFNFIFSKWGEHYTVFCDC